MRSKQGGCIATSVDAPRSQDTSPQGTSPLRRRGNRRGRALRITLIVLLLPFLFWFILLGLIPSPLLANRENTSRAVFDRDGNLLQITLTGDEKYRVWTPLEEISGDAIAATIEYEDRWFWCHPGFNPISIARAALHNLTHTGARPLGASTITMQLVRKRFRTNTRSLSGKLSQIWNALLIERHHSKREILEAYLNMAPYGGNIEGLGAAARIYYRIPASKLTATQAKLLALIPQNPTKRAPLSSPSHQRLIEAWQREYPHESIDTVFGNRSELQRNAPHFVDRIEGLAGSRGEVVTTLSPVMQRLSERVLARFLEQNRSLGFSNGTVMVIDSRSMEVLAYVGSAGYTNPQIHGYVNGLHAKRSPGSTLKPFIYALAIDQGVITPDTLLKDTPLRIANYQPENFERDFLGPLPATEALVRSRNIPAITLARTARNPSLYELLQRAGFSLPRSEGYYGLSLVLGTFEVSMEQVLAAYAMLANGQGVYRPLSWFGPSKDEGTRLFSPEAAYLAQRMLSTNPRPNRLFGTQSFSSSGAIPWKTGTSFGAKDAWAIGIADSIIVGVWVGNFDGKPNPNFVGRDAAGPLLFSIIEGIRAELGAQGRAAAMPRNLKQVEVCPLSGAIASPHCPHARKGWIVPGVSPIRPCSIHREIMIDRASGLRVCKESDTPEVRREVVEVWDSDLLELFALAGLARKAPPPFMRLCEGPDRGDAIVRPPRILSPQENVTYQLRPGGESQVELSAIVDGGRTSLFWFVDDTLVGEGSTVFWRGRPGTFTLRVVDDQGHAATREFTVDWAPG